MTVKDSFTSAIPGQNNKVRHSKKRWATLSKGEEREKENRKPVYSV